MDINQIYAIAIGAGCLLLPLCNNPQVARGKKHIKYLCSKYLHIHTLWTNIEI